MALRRRYTTSLRHKRSDLRRHKRSPLWAFHLCSKRSEIENWGFLLRMPSYLRVMDGFQHSLLLASASFCKMHQNAQCFGYGSTLLIFDPYRRIRAEDFEASLLLIQQPDHSTFLTQETQAALQWDPCWPHVDPMLTPWWPPVLQRQTRRLSDLGLASPWNRRFSGCQRTRGTLDKLCKAAPNSKPTGPIGFTLISHLYIYIQKGSSTEFFMFFPNSQHLACSWAILSSKSAVFKRPAMATARGIGVSREGDSIAPVTPSGVCSPSGIKVVCNAVGRTLGMVGLSISDL